MGPRMASISGEPAKSCVNVTDLVYFLRCRNAVTNEGATPGRERGHGTTRVSTIRYWYGSHLPPRVCRCVCGTIGFERTPADSMGNSSCGRGRSGSDTPFGQEVCEACYPKLGRSGDFYHSCPRLDGFRCTHDSSFRQHPDDRQDHVAHRGYRCASAKYDNHVAATS